MYVTNLLDEAFSMYMIVIWRKYGIKNKEKNERKEVPAAGIFVAERSGSVIDPGSFNCNIYLHGRTGVQRWRSSFPAEPADS